MATVKFEDFGGIAPGITPARLPSNAATIAHNCRLKSGRLEPLHEPVKDTRRVNFEGGLNEIAEAKTIYLWNKSEGEPEWIAWKGRVSVAPSNLALDSGSRLFVVGETGFTDNNGNENAPVMFFDKTYDYSKYGIIKAKLPKPTATRVDDLKDEASSRYTYFFQTWIDEFGYESPISEPSNEVEYNDGQKIRMSEVFSDKSFAGAKKRRIYKVVTGTETEQIQYVTEQDVVGNYFPQLEFVIRDEDAGEIVPQIEAPPATLSDILWMPGGFYAGIDKSNTRTVCFSDINLPYSWPLAYRYTVKDDIVGIALIGNTLVVLTTGSPWLISGTAPEAMSVTALSSPYACVSKDAICTLGSAAYYVSHTGIYGIVEGEATVTCVTATWFSREAWKALKPETARMAVYDQAIFIWFGEGEDASAYVIDFNNAGQVKAVTTHSELASCVHCDVANGKLCYVRSS